MEQKRAIFMVIMVAALGYFVDIFDLILFSIVRVRSLESIGLSPEDVFDWGVKILNFQMTGMLIGGILWGILGDKRGRLSVLFGSIFLYSIANIANAFVQDPMTYAILRFVAGIGLAGELGAGITLVSESMPKESRGYGTTIVATIGILGAVVAVLIGDRFGWRNAYLVGGILGLALLFLRVGVTESKLFKSLKQNTHHSRGNFFQLFRPFSRLRRYLSVVSIALPMWFGVGILVTFAPEIGKAMNMSVIPNAGHAVAWCYGGASLGDLASGLFSQKLRSRKKAVLIFLILWGLSGAYYFLFGAESLFAFYASTFLLGVTGGYWAVFVTLSAEQFGTNLRATASTTAPNLVRGAVVPITLAFQWGKESLGTVPSAIVVGLCILLIALFATLSLEESFGRDLDYMEN